ncbi:MAG: stage II sporulation protein M [Saprospiraceae bacterium]
MRETKFIEQNKQKWREFERTLESNKKDPDKLSNLFIQITDDLSFSRTFYPNRSVRVYLNHLAQKVFYNIYKNRKSKGRNLIRFWTDELPQIMFEARRDLLIAFVLFLFAFTIGAVSTYMNPEFPRVILGDMYVDMTIKNIQNGDPMNVYKDDNELMSSLGITINNISVALFTFVGGVFFMIGTLGVMLYNGIMVGAFQMFFAMQDSYAFKESLLTIWIHGTLEISAIILAGAAGLTMGRGLVFPGTYSRIQAFQVSARRGVKMMLGIFPIFIIAGFIEGFVTRHTGTPDAIRAIFIILCFLFVLIYYVIYPYRKAKRGFVSDINETKLSPTKAEKINFLRIKSNGGLFTDTFVFYRKYLKPISWIAVIGATIYTSILLGIYGYELPGNMLFRRWAVNFPPSWYIHAENIGQLFDYNNKSILMILNTLLFSAIIFFNLKWLKTEQSGKEEVFLSERKNLMANAVNFVKIAAVILAIQLAVLVIPYGWIILFLPIIMLWLSSLILEKHNLFSGIGRAVTLFTGSIFNTYGLALMILLVIMVFSFITNTEMTWYLLDVLGWNFANRVEVTNTFLYGMLIFLFTISFGFFLPILTAAYGILYYSLVEIRDAVSLRERIHTIGGKQKAYGLEKE